MPRVTDQIPRFRVKWRTAGEGHGRPLRAHAILVIEGGRLHWQTLCGRNTVDCNPQYAPAGAPECRQCATHLQPLEPVA